MLQEEKELNGYEIISHINKIKVEKISFQYGESSLIKNFSYDFHKGKVYIIVGDNGTGKSTLVNLIIGIYNDYYSGNIYYDSHEIKTLNMYDAREKNSIK